MSSSAARGPPQRVRGPVNGLAPNVPEYLKMRRLFLSLVLLCNSGGAQPHGAITEAALLGTGPQSLAGVAVDAEGNVYVAGTTTAEDFPDGNLAIGPTGGRSDVFVVKLDPTLTEILFAVRLGGSGEDFVTAMASSS